MPRTDPDERRAYVRTWARNRRATDPEWAERQRRDSRERNRARYEADPAYRAAKAEAARRRRVRLKEAPFRAALERLKAGKSTPKVRAQIVHPGGRVRVSDPEWLCEAGAYSDADKTAEARYCDRGSVLAGTLWERVAHSAALRP
ncbi:hypothetical protein GCM10027414_00840 [Humibacter ginsengiterrae]